MKIENLLEKLLHIFDIKEQPKKWHKVIFTDKKLFIECPDAAVIQTISKGFDDQNIVI